jgi:hypothetical protein
MYEENIAESSTWQVLPAVLQLVPINVFAIVVVILINQLPGLLESSV